MHISSESTSAHLAAVATFLGQAAAFMSAFKQLGPGHDLWVSRYPTCRRAVVVHHHEKHPWD